MRLFVAEMKGSKSWEGMGVERWARRSKRFGASAPMGPVIK